MSEPNKRKYFYSAVTGLPLKYKISENENDNYVDDTYQLIPEDDSHIKNPRLYDDCDDLKEKEVGFFILWNNFRDNHELNEKSDKLDTIEKFLYMFINENIQIIKEKNLINELTLFLNYLLDIGEISFTFFYLWTIKINS